jgi:hypothetical protein
LLFNWVEVQRVGRQVTLLCAGCLVGLANAGDLVARQVVHDDDVVGPERWGQHLADIGEEDIGVDRTINDGRCAEPARTQRADEGGGKIGAANRARRSMIKDDATS